MRRLTALKAYFHNHAGVRWSERNFSFEPNRLPVVSIAIECCCVSFLLADRFSYGDKCPKEDSGCIVSLAAGTHALVPAGRVI